MKKIRCAIYTRKSSEDGLEQEFNSLHAQREACAAYVASQKHEGWVLLPGQYDDGGLSGGSLERPALQQLLADIQDGKIDQIVVYKIDRLTRSLADFAKIVDILDAAGASFVSVTQSFNTATSMGRLTLNMLLSFAQFEREVTAERIRDKIAASKRRGLWMGGQVPMGYDPDGRTLKIKDCEAETIRTLYALYEQHGTIRGVKEKADALGLRTRRRKLSSGETRGGAFDRGHIHHI
ncbi:MAG: recombinase family protein, partial [Ruegeria sp.]|nr:recombinase family protein [Ruegeria sp.]